MIERFEEESPREPVGKQFGCGCSLPLSGFVLASLTVALTVLVATRTDGWSPLWLIVAPLVAGILVLYARIGNRRG